MQRIKVAYLSHVMTFGGASRSLFYQLKALGNSEICKIVILPTDGLVNDAFLEKIRRYVSSVVYLPIKDIHNHQVGRTSLIRSFFRYKKGIKELVDFINNEKIDIVHINSTVFWHLVKPIKKCTNAKVVFHIRELLVPYFPGIISKLAVNYIQKYSDEIISISDNEAKYFSGNKINIVPNSIDFKDFSEIENKENVLLKFNIVNNSINIGMFGVFDESKGHLEFLKIANDIMDKNQDVNINFFIVGVEDECTLIGYKNKIKLFLFKLNLIDIFNVRFYEYYKRMQYASKIHLVKHTNEVFSYLNCFDIVVRPSLSADPWGRDIIEAMAMGKPVVAYGTSDFYVKDGITGFLCSKDKILLINRLQLLIDNVELRCKMGDNSLSLIKNECDLLICRNRLLEIYDRCIK
jgi:glycosyltransferase involved in cell wall biosynthesis